MNESSLEYSSGESHRAVVGDYDNMSGHAMFVNNVGMSIMPVRELPGGKEMLGPERLAEEGTGVYTARVITMSGRFYDQDENRVDSKWYEPEDSGNDAVVFTFSSNEALVNLAGAALAHLLSPQSHELVMQTITTLAYATFENDLPTKAEQTITDAAAVLNQDQVPFSDRSGKDRGLAPSAEILNKIFGLKEDDK